MRNLLARLFPYADIPSYRLSLVNSKLTNVPRREFKQSFHFIIETDVDTIVPILSGSEGAANFSDASDGGRKQRVDVGQNRRGVNGTSSRSRICANACEAQYSPR